MDISSCVYSSEEEDPSGAILPTLIHPCMMNAWTRNGIHGQPVMGVKP